MAIIEVQVVDEVGGVLVSGKADPYLINHIMPELNELDFPLLRFIDPYGDTVFNRYQLREIVPELRRVRERASMEEQRQVLDEFEELVAFALREPGRLLKFLGD